MCTYRDNAMDRAGELPPDFRTAVEIEWSKGEKMDEGFSRELPDLGGAAVRGEAVAKEETGLDYIERLARAATQGQWEYGSTAVATPQEALDICRASIDATKQPVSQFYEVFLMDGRRTALIGNGPTGAANAEYIASLHPANVLHLVSLARRGEGVPELPISARAADAPSEPSDMQWRAQFWKLALALNCLPSQFIDANEHVFEAVESLKSRAADALDRQPTDGGVRNG